VGVSGDTMRLRLRANGLAPRCTGGAAGVARRVCGVQAQDARAARLAIRARSTGLTARDVDADPGVVRTWAWRGTLHLLAREDVPWVLSLVAPGAIRSVAARWRALGLDEAIHLRARAIVAERLGAGPATRAELRDALAAGGVDASGQRLPHLLRRAALEGLLHHPLDGTFAALEVPEPPPREEARAELGRRYAAGYGPATPADLAAFSGLQERGQAPFLQAAAMQERCLTPNLRLLPSFDPYLLGYRGREHAVAPEHARRVWPGGGWLHPVVLVDGRAAGTWRLRDGAVEVDAFGPIPDEPLAAEAADVARFLGQA
jgi:Winged helix DNA-binding domain